MFKFKKSPFTLEETLDAHSDKCGQEFSEVVEKVIIWWPGRKSKQGQEIKIWLKKVIKKGFNYHRNTQFQ